MNILVALFALFFIAAIAVFLYRLKLLNHNETVSAATLIAVLTFFLLAATAVIITGLNGLNIRIPGIDVIITILSFLGVLAIVVIAHELGHFATAKWSGVKVEEFGIGYPPRLFGIKRGETLYSINAIPLGGFTKMSGEEDPKAERSLAWMSAATRVLVLSAGSIMNAILPFLLLAIAYMVPHDMATARVVVDEVSANSPASQAGIMAGDSILEVNDHKVSYNGDVAYYIQMYLGTRITMLIEHADGTRDVVEVVPRWRPPPGDGAVGIGTINEDLVVEKKGEPLFRAISKGAVQAVENMVIFKNSILSMFIGTASISDVTGPVGIAEISGEVARAGWYTFLQWTALLSLNLAIINILPLPALDGGRIAFVVIEWVRGGKRISPRTEALVHAMGFLLLMAIVAAITFQDIVHIAQSGSVLP